MHSLTPLFVEMLDFLIEEGAETPIYLAVVGANGSMLYARYDNDKQGEHLKAKIITKKIFGPGLAAPVHLLWVPTGSPSRLAMISAEGKPEFLN